MSVLATAIKVYCWLVLACHKVKCYSHSKTTHIILYSYGLLLPFTALVWDLLGSILIVPYFNELQCEAYLLIRNAVKCIGQSFCRLVSFLFFIEIYVYVLVCENFTISSTVHQQTASFQYAYTHRLLQILLWKP